MGPWSAGTRGRRCSLLLRDPRMTGSGRPGRPSLAVIGSRGSLSSACAGSWRKLVRGAIVSKLVTCEKGGKTHEKGGKTREAKTGKTCGRISQICSRILRTAVCPSLSNKTCGQNLQNLPGNRQNPLQNLPENRRNPKVSVGAGARIHAPLQKTTGKAAQNRGSRQRSGG